MNSKGIGCGCSLLEGNGSVFAAVNEFGGGSASFSILVSEEMQLWGLCFPLQN